ncbi:hypothetical protein LUZ63_021212 [Rhynchospora breviuscula]|uniref:Response regulatory domain-containing protein n=1 Tax=Rhynchospora breviuscula TaxID=2022672 RepID=A0A9P9Z756_9POAL|nr:hypothetical protein LUZ63_021212 [Rhynchospora breviuscula]
MRFATRTLLLQVGTMLAVVAVCTAVFAWLGVQQLRAEADSSALNIARTVAEAPEVRDLVVAFSADPGTPDATVLRRGALQEYAADVTARTAGLFVVITDDHGIRLAHPDPARLGEVVSTSFADALAGREVVTWETGTLGESARAKVPVYPPGGGAPVGEVSVGFERASVFDDLPALLLGIGVAVLVAVGLGVAVALLARRRLERLTLGVQPEELVALVQTQAAVLDSADEGVVAIDDAGVVRVCTATAEALLGIADAVGRRVDDLGLAPAVATALAGGGSPNGIPIGDRVVFVDVRPVTRGARTLGRVAVLRDRTDLLALTDRLDSVRALGDALRVQRHENANRVHAAVGLLDAGRIDDARAFLADLVDRGSVDWAVPGIELVGDAMLQSFLGAKGLSARERGVALRVSDDTWLRGTVDDVEDVVAVLGNLVDNAVTAAASGTAPREVEVAVLGDGDAIVLTVTDTGGGIVDVEAAFAPRERPDAPDVVHGLGVGLPLSREFARRRGGRRVDRGCRRRRPRSGSGGAAARSPARRERMTDIRVLVVDDDYRVAGLHRDAVDARPGFVALEPARTVGEARAALAAHAPDLVLADVYLPDGDGIELVRAASVDAFVLSAATDAATVRRAFTAGALAFLAKPFDTRVLAERLDRYARYRNLLSSSSRALSQDEIDRASAVMRAEREGASLARSATEQTVLAALGDDEASATEVAERIGVSRATAQRHLTALAERGLVAVGAALRRDRPPRAPLPPGVRGQFLSLRGAGGDKN